MIITDINEDYLEINFEKQYWFGKEAIIDGDLNLRDHNRINRPIPLPDMSLWTIGGDFVCSDNKLTSLKGCPLSVGGSFYCCENQLTSLVELLTIEIGGQIYASNNPLNCDRFILEILNSRNGLIL